jgi:NitT/TauT family transport system permease protein
VVLLLNVAVEGERPYYALTLIGLALTLIILYFAPGQFSNIYGFFVVIASILLFWELYKALGTATGNILPLTDFPWKLPHWQNIAEVLLQPARRNGPFLLVRILGEAALITWLEAITGFIVGSLLGFGLGVLFAHSPLLERGLLPYVVASQTVPIIAIAPMIVSFLGQGWLPVAVISAYLTFFPVTVNSLRGLVSPPALKLELMHSYAASRADILWKLRVPAALPYIFTALKVSATASVVGAIVGELPSSRSDGLAAAILRASGNYAAEPEKLWAAIIMASLVGMAFFSIVSLIERRVLRGITM